jgi:hypothetical protein
MKYNKTTKTFEALITDFPEDGKKVRLALVKINCGPRGTATIKVSIGTSPKGNPVIRVRALKPKIGEEKRRDLMVVPVKTRKKIKPVD